MYADVTLTRSKVKVKVGHGSFELPTTSKAVHAGGDDRSTLAWLSGYVYVTFVMLSVLPDGVIVS